MVPDVTASAWFDCRLCNSSIRRSFTDWIRNRRITGCLDIASGAVLVTSISRDRGAIIFSNRVMVLLRVAVIG